MDLQKLLGRSLPARSLDQSSGLSSAVSPRPGGWAGSVRGGPPGWVQGCITELLDLVAIIIFQTAAFNLCKLIYLHRQLTKYVHTSLEKTDVICSHDL